jgi:protein subunit release factor A
MNTDDLRIDVFSRGGVTIVRVTHVPSGQSVEVEAEDEAVQSQVAARNQAIEQLRRLLADDPPS